MQFSSETTVRMMCDAYVAGYSNSRELCDEIVAEIIAKYEKEKAPCQLDAEPRLYSVEELNKMPAGATFVHSSLGNCTLVLQNGSKFMEFANNGLAPSAFKADNYPWDAPMRRIK